MLTALEAAAAARLLDEDEDGAYHFRHDLIRETLEGDLLVMGSGELITTLMQHDLIERGVGYSTVPRFPWNVVAPLLRVLPTAWVARSTPQRD